MEELLERRVLPFLTIWIWTRKTIRELIQQGPDFFIYGWAILFGISLMITQALFFEWGDILSTSSLLVAIFGFGPLAGLIYWLVYSVLFHWLGRLFGGSGTLREMRTAVAWAMIPYSARLVLILPLILLFGSEMLSRESPTIDREPYIFIFLLFLLFSVVISIWFLFVLFKSVAEVHQFSSWKACIIVLISIPLLWAVLLFGFKILLFPF